MNPEASKLAQLSSLLAQRENLAPEFQAMLAKLGVDVVMVAFDGHASAPVWAQPDVSAQINAALIRETCGEYDDMVMANGFCFLFYHCRGNGRALGVIKAELERLNLLDHAQILVAEPEAGWRAYWPATAELIETK